MQKQKIKLPEIILVGLSVRTNNKNEMTPKTSKISELVNSYHRTQVADNIKFRKNPGTTYCVYTDYESDEHGDYTYFIGEAVSSNDDQDLTQLHSITIPESNYQKFTTDAGKMPDIVISSWQEIWTMNEKELGGNRKYLADFEIYDQRAYDPNNTIVDIYIGIEN